MSASQFTPLLYSRRQAAILLGYASIDPIIELQKKGKLTPVRPTGRPRGQVFYRRSELEAIAGMEAQDVSASS
ncbi:MAG: hypothetical protein ACRECX_13520 [Methyloceanibacter sp.]|uniref:hypothetical protein n=1 Tax=Methyloceanibacter sp. TaxID=1965321 RepID=UPI003D6D6309